MSGRLLSSNESLQLATYLAQLSQAGLPLPGSLRALAQDLPSGRLSRVILQIAEQLEAGRPLEEIVESPSGPLPEYWRELIAAGARSGRLPELLEDFLDYHAKIEQRHHGLRQAMAYPSLLLLILVCIFVLAVTQIVPSFREIYDDFGIQLPLATQLLMWLSGKGFWRLGALLLAALLVGVAVWIFGRRAWVDRLVLNLPGFGAWRRDAAMADLCFLLSAILKQSVPLPRALELSASMMRGSALAGSVRKLAGEIGAGRSLSDAIAAKKTFPPTLVPIIRWGEQQHALGSALSTAAEMYGRRAVLQAAYVQDLLPPYVLLFIVTMVLFLVRGLIFPLAKVVSSLT